MEYDVISVEPHEKVVHALVKPRRLETATAADLDQEVTQAAMAAPNLPIVLDFSNVKFAPSVALGALVNLFKAMKMANRRAFLVGVNHQIRGALSVTRIDTLIDIRDNLAHVLKTL